MKILKNENGFTITEILIAITIMIIVLIVSLSSLGVIFKSRSSSQNMALATQYGRNASFAITTLLQTATPSSVLNSADKSYFATSSDIYADVVDPTTRSSNSSLRGSTRCRIYHDVATKSIKIEYADPTFSSYNRTLATGFVKSLILKVGNDIINGDFDKLGNLERQISVEIEIQNSSLPDSPIININSTIQLRPEFYILN